MPRIVVVHPGIPGNGEQTTFDGPTVSFIMGGHGELMIEGWTTNEQWGSALFAPGKWAYVCLSKPGA